MTREDIFDHRAYEVYCEDEQYAALNLCPACDGYGYDGIEEDSGRMFSCYACGETGRYYPVKEAA